MFVRLVLTVALSAGLAVAQRGGGGGGAGGDSGGIGAGGGMGGGEGMNMPRAQRQTKAEIFMDKMKLNKDQKEDAIKILTESAQKARALLEPINRERQQIANALLQKKTEEEMKPLMQEYTKICAQMTAIEVEAFGKIYATLKPNQQKNAPQAFEYLSGMFMPAAVPAGRGMGRGQDGGSGRGGRN